LSAPGNDEFDVEYCDAGSLMLTALGLKPPLPDRPGRAAFGEGAGASVDVAVKDSDVAAAAEEATHDFEVFCEHLTEPDAVLPEREPAGAMVSSLRS